MHKQDSEKEKWNHNISIDEIYLLLHYVIFLWALS